MRFISHLLGYKYDVLFLYFSKSHQTGSLIIFSMRAFSTLNIATEFALSVNSAHFDKEAVSAPVQFFFDDINPAVAHLAIVKADVSTNLAN